jgi:hypothetical protein
MESHELLAATTRSAAYLSTSVSPILFFFSRKIGLHSKIFENPELSISFSFRKCRSKLQNIKIIAYTVQSWSKRFESWARY